MSASLHDFVVATSEVGQLLHIYVGGDFDAMVVSQFEEAVAPGDAVELRLCLADVTMIDSSALGAIVRLHRESENRGATLKLHAPRPFQQDLIKITGLHHILKLTTECTCTGQPTCTDQDGNESDSKPSVS